MDRKELEGLPARPDINKLLWPVDVVSRFNNVMTLSHRLRNVREKRMEALKLYQALRHEEDDLDEQLHSELNILAAGE